MNKQRRILLGATFLLVTAAAYWGRVQSQIISRKPYTAWVQVEHFTNGSSQPQRRVQLIQAVRADGSSMRESRWDQETHATQELIDTTAAKVHAIDTATRSYTEAPLRPESAARRRGPVTSNCEAVFGKCEPGGTVLGYSTYLVEIRPPGSGRITKQWVAPDLAWAILREETWQQGTLTAQSTSTKIVEGEPAVAMFRVPAGYRKVDAARQLTESAAARGASVDAAAAEQIRQRIESQRPQ